MCVLVLFMVPSAFSRALEFEFGLSVIMTSIGKSVDASKHLHCFVDVQQTFDPFNGKLIQRCGEICRPHAMLCGQLLSIFW